MEKCNKNYKLETTWILWSHKLDNTSWDNKSYKKIFEINNLYDYKLINDIITINNLQNSMFFLMRKNIFPTWEDPDNREGCCISFKISGGILKEQWDFIMNNVLIEDILKDKSNSEYLNGISISPKKEFNIVKLWLRKNDENYTDHLKEYEPYFTKEKSLIKKHELSD